MVCLVTPMESSELFLDGAHEPAATPRKKGHPGFLKWNQRCECGIVATNCLIHSKILCREHKGPRHGRAREKECMQCLKNTLQKCVDACKESLELLKTGQNDPDAQQKLDAMRQARENFQHLLNTRAANNAKRREKRQQVKAMLKVVA